MCNKVHTHIAAEEKEEHNTVTHARKTDSRTAIFAGALLLREPEPFGPGSWMNKSVCESLGLSESTMERLTKRFVEAKLTAVTCMH
ncbi:MAG: hypothetical protein LBP22_00010 [Deltaproteobacteria bacterium]|nr:hypothetical protein [Deltaproteobacteria bacterium]